MSFHFTRILCGRSLLANNLGSIRYPVHRNATMKIVPQTNLDNLTYEEKNMLLKREMSPHLTIYKFQLTSMLSISHRFTGLALTFYVASLGFGSLVMPQEIGSYIALMDGTSSASLMMVKFLVAFPATYHTCNGVRHLFWDMGKFLQLKEVYTTGWLMLGVSTTLAILLTTM